MRKVSDRHRQWLVNELPELERVGVLSSDVAVDIRQYYQSRTQAGVHWAVVAFSIIGSLLIGAGIILLFAHNWEDLSRPTRAVLSFCPLIIGAAVSVLALTRNGGLALRESAGILHTLAVGATISLIGQTYHLPSNAPGFLMTWALLTLPLIFLLRSMGAFLIYLALICGWTGMAQQTYGQATAFWLLLLPAAGRQIYLTRTARHDPGTLIGFAGILLALCISVGMVFERTVPGLWMVAYSALLSAAGLLGLLLYEDRTGWSNVPKTFGMLGIVVLTYLFTWTELWDGIGWAHRRTSWQYNTWGIGFDSGITLLLLIAWLVAAVRAFRRDSMETVTLAVFPVISCIGFIIGSVTEHSELLNSLIFNAFMLFLGVMYIIMGCREARLRQLNAGMAILSLLLVTRFFDAEFGYMARGIVFIVLGAVFLSVNLVMVRHKNKREVSA